MNVVQRLGSDITMDDFYCGGGGETTGAKKLGINVRHAFNHWSVAIETHNANHPETTHIQADIGTYDPYAYKPSIMAWFSPECKTFSMGLGKSQTPQRQMMLPGMRFEEYDLTPQQERSRVTAGDILRHVEAHRYRRFVVENVVGFRLWEKFDDWLKVLINFGYDYRIVYLNSMFCHPTPQSRDRMYTCFWLKGDKAPDLDIYPKAYCEKCGRDVDAVQTRKPTSAVPYMTYGAQYTYNCPTCASIIEPYYYASANIIDWTNVGTRIGDRKKPLAPKTMERIEKGFKRYIENPPTPRRAALYHGHVPRAFISPYHHDTADRSRSVYEELPTVDGSPRFGLVMLTSTNRMNERSRAVDEPFPTQTGGHNMGLTFAPMITSVNYFSERERAVDEPMPTQTTSIKSGLTLMPFVSSYNGQSVYTTPDQAISTMTGTARHALVAPQSPHVEDCYFRMFTVDEVKQAMGFPSDYILLGTQRDQVELAGQAVTPDAARVLLSRMVESLA